MDTQPGPKPPAVAPSPGAGHPAPRPLQTALTQSKDLKIRIETAADDLGAATAIVSDEIARVSAAPQAHQALVNSKQVEITMRDAAQDLVEVNQSINLGIRELKQADIQLSESRKSVAATAEAMVALELDKKADIDRSDLLAFHASVAQELAAPLQSIGACCDLLERKYGALLEVDGRECLATIRAAAATSARFADDLLESSPVSVNLE